MTIPIIGTFIAVFCLVLWIVNSFQFKNKISDSWKSEHIYRWGKGEFK